MFEEQLLMSARNGTLAKELVRLGLWESELLEVEFHQPPEEDSMHAKWVTTHPGKAPNGRWRPQPDYQSGYSWIFMDGDMAHEVSYPGIYHEITSDNFWDIAMIMIRHNLAMARADQVARKEHV